MTLSEALTKTLDQVNVKVIFPEDDMSKYIWNEYTSALKNIDMSSIPGSCMLRQLGTTNAQVFCWEPDTRQISKERFLMVHELLINRIHQLLDGYIDCDNIYTFVKNEPHKIKKIAEGRLRLISGVSLLDTLIDRILFQRIVQAIQDNVGNTPIAVGWNPVVGAQLFYHHMGHHNQYLSVDKSHWDWSVHSWLLEAVKKFFKSTMLYAPNWWLKLVDARFRCLFEHPIWEFQDGSTIQQRVPGIMKSGCYLTLMLNSVCQVILHNYVSVQMRIPQTPFWTLGDDTIQVLEEGLINDYLDNLSVLGFEVRYELSRIPEFVGFHIPPYHHVPAYRNKHCFMLKHLTCDEDDATATLLSYQLMYCNVPEVLAEVRRLIRKRCLDRAFFDDYQMAIIQHQ